MSKNSKPRNVLFVACYIETLIPEDNKEFKNELIKLVKTDFAYKPPEILDSTSSWLKLDTIMKKYIPEIKITDELWKKHIVDVYTGKFVVPELEDE
jgi:hypothetical protein